MMPPISRYMTAQPWTVERDSPLREARRLMADHGIRHLPVLHHGELVGVVSDRDLRLLEGAAGGPVGLVTEVMAERPFIVATDTAVDEVVQIMSEHKYGSVIVMGRDGIAGIFTTIDACRVLADVLQRAAAQ